MWAWGELCPVFKVRIYSVSEESVKDLIRYLRHEDETRDVRQQLGAFQIMQSDLLPIVTQHHKDKPLFDAVIRFIPQLFNSYHMPAFIFKLIGFGVCAWQGSLMTSPSFIVSLD